MDADLAASLLRFPSFARSFVVVGRDLLFKYFGQLELLELRFPDIKVPFPW